MRKTFDEWMREVDAEVRRRTGLSWQDLNDTNYAEMYEQGKSPKVAASKAIRLSGSE